MTESPARFSNLTKDNIMRKNEENESATQPAVLYTIHEKSNKPDVLKIYHEIYNRHPSYQKRFMSHQHIDESVNYLKSFQSENQDETFEMKFTIDENFETFDSKILNELSNIHQNKSMILLFMGKNGKKFLVYWKMAGMNYFCILKEFKLNPDLNYKEFYEFIGDFLLNQLRHKRIGFYSKHDSKNNEIDVSDLADFQNCNLFQNAAEVGEFNVVKTIIQHWKMMDLAKDFPNYPLSPQALAIRNGYFNVFAMLIKAGYTYPLFLDTKNFSDEIKKFIEIGENMHKAIKSRNKEKIEKILAENPKQKHYYNLKNKSALRTAVAKKSYDIYKFLLNNGVEFGPHEEFFTFLTPREKRNLTEFHFKHSKDLPDSHINILMMNTTVSHYENNHNDKEQYIKKAYEFLNQIPSIKVILEAVAASKKFEIVFDFKRDSVHMVDVNANPNTKGLFTSCGKICIGAKQLLNPSTEHETFGTIAHELCHYALYLTYKNAAKPYSDKDKKSLKNFEEISSVCKDKQDGENLIKMVYNIYKEYEIHAELAVRAPHLIAQYYNAPEKLKKAREEYREMFDYYENIMVLQMKEALPRIMKEAEEMSSDKIVFICFIISMVLLGLMGAALYFWLYTPFYEYVNLSVDDKMTVRNAIVKYKGVDVILCNLYPNNTKIYQNLTSEHITNIFDNEKLDLSNPFFTYLTNSIFFSWTNLTKPLKWKFLNSTTLFQTENVKLSDLNVLHPNAFNSLTSEQIISVLDGNVPLVISSMKQMSAKFYINRTFIPENSIMAQIKYDNIKNKTSFEEFYESYPKEKLTAEFKARRVSYSTHVGNSVEKISEYNAVKSLMEYKNFHKSLNNVTKDAEDSRLFVLSSEAGAGKTATFEYLAMKLKKMHPTKWVSYIDLKDHTQFYQDFMNAENLLQKILNLTSENEFERKIFEDSYKSNNSIFLWNGYDEVSPIYSNFTLDVIKDIQQNTKNIQYISTRPLYSNELNENFNVDPHMLVPFNSDEQAEFLQEYFKAKNSTIMSDPNEMVSRVLNLTKKLILDANKQYDTPLLLTMFAEVSTDTPNLYKIFDQFFAKKQKILEDKNLAGTLNLYKNPPNSNFNILQIYQQFAVKVDIFPFAFSTHPAIHQLYIFKKMNLNRSYYADISRTGILYIHDETKFEFAHKTFAEFFIAQYFIDNIYNAYGLLDEKEADARLELFFLAIQYSLTFDKVIEFVRDYVKYDTEKNPFHEEIKKVLKNKYKKHLIYILNKTYEDSFRFFFEFFKKDKELMLDLLKVNENETFYTALFNPFYNANHLDPRDIKNIVEPYLTSEFNSFINGQHQRGVMLYGMFDRQENVNLATQNFSISNETSFWDFYDIIKHNLTSEELNHLFLNPIITFIYRKHSSTYETNQKFWMEVQSLFDKQDMTIFLGNLFPQIFRPKLEIPSVVDANSLDMLINKTQNILSSDKISKLATKTHLIFRSARSFPQLQIVWDFVANHTSLEERRELLKFDFRKNQSTEHQQFYSTYYKFFVMTPMVLHVNIFADNFTDSIDFVEKIYNQTFKKPEIQDFFLDSNNFLFPLIFTRPIEACQKVAALLERLFEGNEQKLVELIEKDFNDTKLTIFEYFDKMLAFDFRERKNVKERLKIFSDLRNKLKNSKKPLA